ncbi:4Fe-4S dicluster domain-containing protein [Effusibacillus consociatus]|uniref:4Fe-4S dicluster domain-containing protein n=1 Tax=Effusibacillus consociatus TaxID=1117041 RepID=A0ABV9Q9W2_9BACL
MESLITLETVPEEIKWGKVIDQDKCIGCHACSTACKSEHLVPLSVNRTYVKQVEVGIFPEVNRHFQINRCNQCEDAPCVPICPVEAMYKRSDGIVDFDRDVCIGCKACIAACPYDAIYISPESNSAEKCNFCAHRIEQGLEPACVVVCPEEAIIIGNLNDPNSEVSKIVARDKTSVRKPEKGTNPKVFYKGASDYTLNPSAARYTAMHLFSEQKEKYPVLEEPFSRQAGKSAAAAIVAYDVPHKAPWDWRVSAYTWTKSISAGVFMMFAVISQAGVSFTMDWKIALTLIAGLFLGLTGAFLVGDLAHPKRFLRVLTRPQWKSWLTRGAYIILGYSIILGINFIGSLTASDTLLAAIRWPGFILATFTAIYTAFLFSQAKGRDLWQNPLLPLHLFAQAILAGAGVMLLLNLAFPLPEAAMPWVRWSLFGSLAVHLILVISEMVIPHMTADAAKAAYHMTFGHFRKFYWTGVIAGTVLPLILLYVGGLPLLGIGATLALIGLMAYEHAYVQAGQSVPLS